MNVGELKRKLQNVPDDVEVRIWYDSAVMREPVGDAFYLTDINSDAERSVTDGSRESFAILERGVDESEMSDRGYEITK